MSAHVDQVRRYYDVNTPAFERFGQGGHDGVIRRAVWGKGVVSRSEAFRYVDDRIAEELDALHKRFAPPVRVLDFGCGLGTSLLRLAAVTSIEGVGITVSRAQAEIARARSAATGLGPRVQWLEADFLALPSDLAPAHLTFAIEAFVHAPTPRVFFEAAARHLISGGTLIVCDDFLSERSLASVGPDEARCLEEFRQGWLAPSAVTLSRANEAAAAVGFTQIASTDLTPYLELRRPRDRLLSMVVRLGRSLPVPGYRWRSLKGGNALQEGLISGLIEYRYTVWRRGS